MPESFQVAPQLSFEQANLQIYIPTSLLRRTRSGTDKDAALYLFGWAYWANEEQTFSIVVIAGVLTKQEVLKNQYHSQDASKDSNEICLLGEVIPHSVSLQRHGEAATHIDTRSSNGSTVKGHQSGIWLMMKEPASKRDIPQLQSVRIVAKNESLSCAISTVIYEIPRPDQMQYTSLEPMILPQSSGADASLTSHQKESIQSQRLERLVDLDPVRFADLNHRYKDGTAPGEAFRHCIDLINQVAYAREATTSSNLNWHDAKVKRSKESKFAKSWEIAAKSAQSIRTLLTSSIHPSIPALVTISASARQLSLRLGQISIWPSLARRLRLARVREHQPVSLLGPQYTALYNGVWLVANDLIVGQAVGLILCDRSDQIATFLKAKLGPILTVAIIETLHWLDSWPLGVKLNTPLSRFFCDMYTGMTEIWSEQVLAIFMSDGSQALCRLIYLIGIATRFFGLSMMLCIVVDVLNLVTFYLNVFYLIQWRMYAFFCSSLTSLFYLFRGKKRNPLRKMRTDYATYDLDQLLLGTIFFTILLFLWLTVATYYALFSFIRLFNVSIIALLQTALAVINHLPLFALMLRVKDPARLPGGVAFRVRETRELETYIPTSHFEMISVPLGLSDIFRGQERHVQNLSRLPGLAFHILIGKRI
ncbi:Gpi1-domain-containing protein [Meira miltonrushii]|uniref:Gpi1-domain-containing protein n=1 Tax=Meira miltonrushii TaxID=1280837 RepID=A0A316VCG5_9BASI|nr:Gpi1-domain-containing protein [Meira miltonrushii]PWN35252.1 Gpi1-domain-containing protein [Meira miltonrushii]